MNRVSDQLLISNILAGDTQAFAILVDRYQNFVFTIAVRILKNREEAEEVAQDSFIKAYNALNGFRGDSKFSSWLYRIVYHKSLDRLKGKKPVHFNLIEEITEDTYGEIENGLESLLQQERSEIIKNCIESLPADEAAIISFFYFDEKSIKEISSITDLTEDNVKVKLFRSRKKLFSLLSSYIKEISPKDGKAV